MNNLKAIIKGTDRVIDVVSYSRDNNWIEYEEIEDGQVRYNTKSLDEVELIVDNAPSPIDWEQRKYEIAKDVLSSSFSTPMEGTSIISYVRSCVQIADMLVAELKGGEQ